MWRIANDWQKRWAVGLVTTSLLASGCVRQNAAVHYLGKEHHQFNRSHATQIDFAAVDQQLPDEVVSTAPPHTIDEINESTLRDIHLSEALHGSLLNSQIIRTSGSFQTGGGVLGVANNSPSVYDPAIQETGVLFGGRGVEAALAAFDAQLTSSMVWGRNELAQNNPFFGGGLGGGGVAINETAQFQSTLAKSFAHGGTVNLNHNVNYLGTNAPSVLFPSSYTGNLQLQYQLPLLAGAGTEYTRIAGPIGQNFGGISGVSQGVVIARINNDITITEFEQAVQQLTRDVENTYWDLYLAYRIFHTAVTAKESALLTWRIADLQLQGGVRTRAEVAQARDQYFATDAAVSNSRSEIFTAEIRLRRLMGLAVNDGTTLRPVDDPVSAQLVPDWYTCLTEALTQRVELQRQKWHMKSLELQLRAAKSLVRPRLDFVGGYQVNGFGDDLVDYDPSTRYDNFYDNLSHGDQTGWNLGLQFRWDIGFRSAMAQVRNYELRLAKSQKVLEEQEQEVSLELAATFQELSRSYTAAETNMNRLLAARENVKFLEPNIREGTILLDELLRAQLRQAEAEVAYHRSLVDYNKSLNDLQFRKGTILEHNAVSLAEGPWHPDAYYNAERNSNARNHAIDGSGVLETVPEPFASGAPVGGVFFTDPGAQPFAPPTEARIMDNLPQVGPAEEPVLPVPAGPPPAE